MPPGLDQSQKLVGPEKLTTALICARAVSSHPMTAPVVGSSAHQRARVPPAEPPHEIDVAIALRVGKRRQNLPFKVVGLLGRIPVVCVRLTVQSVRRRKAVINLKDQEARKLEVAARLPLGRNAAVLVLQFEYVWRKHEHRGKRRIGWPRTGRHEAIALQDASVGLIL